MGFRSRQPVRLVALPLMLAILALRAAAGPDPPHDPQAAADAPASARAEGWVNLGWGGWGSLALIRVINAVPALGRTRALAAADGAGFAAVMRHWLPQDPRAAVVVAGTPAWSEMALVLKIVRQVESSPNRRQRVPPLLRDPLLPELLRRNRRRTRIPIFPADRPLRFTTDRELAALAGPDRWKAFWNRFPDAGGQWEFSLPGYSRDRRRALLFFWHGAGILNGSGSLVSLRKRGDRWQVVDLAGWKS
jgi:hypothetical protein